MAQPTVGVGVTACDMTACDDPLPCSHSGPGVGPAAYCGGMKRRVALLMVLLMVLLKAHLAATQFHRTHGKPTWHSVLP